ncbi:MAG: TetR family transcriptional regulator [Pseudomonadota bacterium]|nr:TetR family transcriptional regulator [Pseudomonadota bacterium]
MSLRDERKQQTRQALLDAALSLSTAGRSFSMISLREVAREAGLVPTAFYRHFVDMDALGVDLVDQVCVVLHQLLKRLRESYTVTTSSHTRLSMEQFFYSVEDARQHWAFLVGERWGGTTVVREAIAKEVQFFIEDLSRDMQRLPSFEHLVTEDVQITAEILINLAFSWAMTWLNLPSRHDPSDLATQREHLIARSTRQAQLLFRGSLNWQSQPH